MEGFDVNMLWKFNRYRGSRFIKVPHYQINKPDRHTMAMNYQMESNYYVIDHESGEPTKTGWIYINREN